MKKLIVFSVTAGLLCASIAVFAQKGTGPDGRPAKSAKDICHRKCAESMDKCMEGEGMNRVKCGKQNSDCHESCDKMLN